MVEIWNEVVEAGNAFPQTEPLTLEEARSFFAEQSHTAVATVNGRIRGLYILHPNNIGRCGHVANASFAVAGTSRGEGILGFARIGMIPGGFCNRDGIYEDMYIYYHPTE